MNNNEICFVICSNNQTKLNECISCLNTLIVPDGYSIDLLTIEDADTIASGYNEAMCASDARIKIYLHQDVYILNKYMLIDIVNLFDAEPSAKMLGLVGYEKMSADAIMWSEERIGGIYLPDLYKQYEKRENYRYDILNDGYKKVAVCDGFLIATNADVEWDTEVVDGWDFYDATQCMRFLEKGYEIIVPNQRLPWCIHDDGGSLYVPNYNRARLAFAEKYKHCLGKRWSDIIRNDEEIPEAEAALSFNQQMEEYFKWVESYKNVLAADKEALIKGLNQVLGNRQNLMPGELLPNQSLQGIIKFLKSERGMELVTNLPDVKRIYVTVLAMNLEDENMTTLETENAMAPETENTIAPETENAMAPEDESVTNSFGEGVTTYEVLLDKYLTVLYCFRRLYFSFSEEMTCEATSVLETLNVSPYIVTLMLAQEWSDGDPELGEIIKKII